MSEDTCEAKVTSGQMAERLLRERFEKNKKIDDELNQHPLFMTDVPAQGAESEAFQSLQAIIAETPPAELATNLKNSGNEAFALGRTRWDDAIAYYSQVSTTPFFV